MLELSRFGASLTVNFQFPSSLRQHSIQSHWEQATSQWNERHHRHHQQLMSSWNDDSGSILQLRKNEKQNGIAYVNLLLFLPTFPFWVLAQDAECCWANDIWNSEFEFLLDLKYLSFHLKIIVSTSHLLLCSLLLMFFWCCCCAAMRRRILVEGIRAAAKVFLEIYSRRDTFNVTYRKVSWSEAKRVDTCASDALNSMSMRVCAVQMKNERIRSWLSKVGCFFKLPRLISQNIKLHSIWTRIYSFFSYGHFPLLRLQWRDNDDDVNALLMQLICEMCGEFDDAENDDCMAVAWLWRRAKQQKQQWI